MSAAGIGKPGRHAPGAHVFLNLARLESGLAVGDQRHQADLAGAVTALAMVLKDGKDVAVEGGGTRTLRLPGEKKGENESRWQKGCHRNTHATISRLPTPAHRFPGRHQSVSPPSSRTCG